LEALENKIGKANVLYAPGADLEKEDDLAIQKAVQLARSYKNHLMFRRKNYTETPGDISNLYLSQSQIKLALALSKLNKPIILIFKRGTT
jgi:beta-glucosidase